VTQTIEITVPEGLEHYALPLKELVEAQLFKLHLNRRKDSPARPDVNILIARWIEEFSEVLVQIATDRTDLNTLYEISDANNFGLLLYVALRDEIGSKDA
jgi:hypothetical protein